MKHYKDYLLHSGTSIKEALKKLNQLSEDGIIFVVDNNLMLLGSLTDGDVRRGFLKNLTTSDSVDLIIKNDPKFLKQDSDYLDYLIELREEGYLLIPILDDNGRVVDIINFRLKYSKLPVDVVLMAGGRGERLRPLTYTTPKPLLLVGEKPIIQHNIDRIRKFGITNFWISVHYLGEKIISYFKANPSPDLKINYCFEDKPLGTFGVVTSIKDFNSEYILVTNSDLLTNVDYENFFQHFKKSNADISVLSIPYEVNIPYAVLQVDEEKILSFEEKPTYTYYSNGGIYLIRREILNLLPKNEFLNATDMIQFALQQGLKVTAFPFSGFWLDVGRPSDYEKAQNEINKILL
jgi:dTDP-glucose pyrophosphorylase